MDFNKQRESLAHNSDRYIDDAFSIEKLKLFVDRREMLKEELRANNFHVDPEHVRNVLETAFREYYGFSEIPTEFLAEHPQIIFDTVSLARYMTSEHPGKKIIPNEVSSRIETSGYHLHPITSLSTLLKVLSLFEGMVFRTEEEYQKASSFVEEAFERYNNNLNLYKLVQDPLGTVARNGSVGEEDISEEKMEENPPWMEFNHPSDFVAHATRKKMVTFWSRRGFESIGSGRRENLWMRKTTVRQLENDG